MPPFTDISQTPLHGIPHAAQNEEPCLGWICSYVPEEIILAAGFTPVRIQTSPQDSVWNKIQLPANLCPYTQRLLQAMQAFHPKSPTGVILAYSCDSMRRLADMLEKYLQLPFSCFLDIPRKTTQQSVAYYLSQLQQLKAKLQAYSGSKIYPEDLEKAIATINHTRALISEMTKYRSMGRISGKLFQEIAILAQTSNKLQLNTQLEIFLQELKNSQMPDQPGAKRILICGCLLENNDLFTIAEQGGAEIIADDLCNGQRFFSEIVPLRDDPMQSLAGRYLQRPSCARMLGRDDRIQRIIQRAQENNCSGIIQHTLKFCDLWQSETPALEIALKGTNMHFLHLEREDPFKEEGQLKTRIQAFIEKIRT